jgi:glutathione S-transferase
MSTNKLYALICDQIVGASFKSVFTIDETEREKHIEESTEALKILENELKGKFFGGEEINFVDIAAVFIAFWIPLIQDITDLKLFTDEKFPKLYNWSQEFLNHPVVKENLPPRDPLFAFFKARYDGLLAASQ